MQAVLFPADEVQETQHNLSFLAKKKINVIVVTWFVTCFFFVSFHSSSSTYFSQLFEVAKKPKRGDRIPKKGKMVEGKTMTVKSWGTVRQEPSDGLNSPS